VTAVWYWSRRTARAHWRSYVGAAVLLALLGGLTMAALAGARRTASAYPRFRAAGHVMDAQVNSGDFESQHPEVAGQMPGVTESATYIAFLAGILTPDGGPDTQTGGEVAGSLDGLYFTHDRFAVTEGRLPDPSRPDEIAVNEIMATTQGVEVGRTFDIGVFDPADEDQVYSDTPPPFVDRLDVTVVGIGLFPDEVVQDDTNRIPRMLFTPAFTERNREWVSYAWTAVKVDGGVAGVEQFKRDYIAVLPDGANASFRETSLVTNRAQEAVRPLAVALGAFGVLAAAATLLLVGQALIRLLRADRHDLATLRAMGARPRLVAAVCLPGAAASIGAGVAGAVVVAVLLSPLAPIGPMRRVEADPGVSFDWAVLALGAVAFAAVLGVIVIASAIRQAPHRRLAGGRVARPSRLVGAASASGLPLPAVAGMRLAVEAGEGRTAVPVRAAVGGAIVAVVALVSSLVFGTSLRSLVDHPRLYGWDWDVTAMDDAGYGDFDVARAGTLLDSDPAVAGWSGAYFQSVDLDGQIVPAIGMPSDASVTPPLLSGRQVRGPGEAVLGSATLADLGKRVGDTVVLDPGESAQPLLVVGTAVFPTVGPVFGAYTSLGDGAMMVYDQIPGWDEISPGPKALFVRFRPGADRDAAIERITKGLPGISKLEGTAELLDVQRPAQIVNYGAMGAAPALLGGVLVLAAVVSLGLTLASGVNRRRRDLSILKSLGFTRRQVSSTVVWQSSIIVGIGLVVGVPVGVALGRWLWILFAGRLPVVARPTVPILVLAGIACGLVVVANLVAAGPARVAGRTPVASILRSE
jgi:hypothetical protein